MKLLGIKTSIKTAQTLIEGELKKYLDKVCGNSKESINDV